MKKIIATGITGLVGSRVVELIGNKYNFVNFSLDSGIDITRYSLLEKKFEENKEACAVLHLAAFTDVSKAWEQNENKNSSCYLVNVLGSKNIAQLCKKYGMYLVHISTDFVFDGENPPKGGYREKDEPNPIEWYGETKLWAEREVERSGCKNCILRIAFPYKAKKAKKELEPNPKLDLVRKIKKRLENREEVQMFADQIITPTFIDDFAKVIDICFADQPGGIFHAVGSSSLSPYDLAVSVAEKFGLDKSLINKSNLEDYLQKHPDSRPRQKEMIISNEKLVKELGVRMLGVDEGLEEIRRQLT